MNMEKYSFTREIGGDFIATQAVDISIAFSKDLYDNKILIGEQITIIQEAEKFISQANIQFQE